MNEIQTIVNYIFENEDVRSVVIDSDTYFVGKDVATILGYANTRQAIQVNCKGSLHYSLPSNGGSQDMTIIPLSDLFRLIVRSKKPEAIRFEKWVMEVVLPRMYKNGGYVNGEEYMTLGAYQEALTTMYESMKKELDEKDLIITQQQEELSVRTDKELKYEAVVEKLYCYSMDDVTRIVSGMFSNKFIGLTIGRNTMYQYLAHKKILWKRKSNNRYYIGYKLKNKTELYQTKLIDNDWTGGSSQITYYTSAFCDYVFDAIVKDINDALKSKPIAVENLKVLRILRA